MLSPRVVLNRAGFWLTIPICPCKFSISKSLIWWPSNLIVPEIGSYSLRINLAVVLLPAPESPTTAVILLDFIFRLNPFNTFSTSLDGYSNSTFSNSISALHWSKNKRYNLVKQFSLLDWVFWSSRNRSISLNSLTSTSWCHLILLERSLNLLRRRKKDNWVFQSLPMIGRRQYP